MDGACADGTVLDCAALGGVFLGANTTCLQGGVDFCATTASCGVPEAGSCCVPNGTPGCDDSECCALVCAWYGDSCCDEAWDEWCAEGAESLCAPQCLGVCCHGVCETATEEECLCFGGVYFPGQSCEDTPDMCDGPCCFPTGECFEVDAVDCDIFHGVWHGLGTCDDPNECSTEIGACCSPSGQCYEIPGFECYYTFLGPGTTCDDTDCNNEPPTE